MPLLMHIMKFDAKLGTYLGDMNKDMMDKVMEIWMRIQAMAMALDMTPDAQLGLALFLLDRLPVISAGLSFWQDIPFSLACGPEAITFQKRTGTSHSTPLAPDDLGDAKSNTKASLPLAQVGQAMPRSRGIVPNKNSPDEPGKPVPQITADFGKAPLLKHSSLVKTMRLTQESTTDVEFPEKPQKDNSNSKQSTSSESGAEEEAEIEPAGSGSEDASSGDQTKVDDTHDGTSPMPGTPLQSGNSESSEEEEGQEGMISNSTDEAESMDEDKPTAASTSRDSQGVAPLSLTPLLVKHGEKIRYSRHQADARCLDTHLKSFQTGLGDQDKAVWAKQETMKCSKKHKDPLGTLLKYMKACKVFKPLAMT